METDKAVLMDIVKKVRRKKQTMTMILHNLATVVIAETTIMEMMMTETVVTSVVRRSLVEVVNTMDESRW